MILSTEVEQITKGKNNTTKNYKNHIVIAAVMIAIAAIIYFGFIKTSKKTSPLGEQKNVNKNDKQQTKEQQVKEQIQEQLKTDMYLSVRILCVKNISLSLYIKYKYDNKDQSLVIHNRTTPRSVANSHI